MTDTLVQIILKETNYHQNPYFVALKNGEFSKEDFIETQIQFYWAVIFFSRPMAVLAAKIPEPKLRLEILRNVWEEHGEGDISKMHGNTFKTLLSRLGNVQEKDMQTRALWPEIRSFNENLIAACTLDHYLVGCGAMGIIERMFVDISFWIGSTITDRGWLTKEQMIHYNLHEELDIKHSKDFFDVLDTTWNQDIKNQYRIEQGLRLGAYIFNTLYRSLYESRKRRLLINPNESPEVM
ncbi:MAG: iron-containing redox enzyme family protein [Candidatus Vogelbacteria bacterium]|nr:iron-containing redox enzyme family protein [Candidatus Vogelbacteria bacterium]